MATNVAEYQVIVNWEAPQEILLDTFENSLNGWTAEAGVTAYTTQVTFETLGDDDWVAWAAPNGPNPLEGPLMQKTLTGLVVGQVYRVKMYVMPLNNSYHVKLTCTDSTYDTYTAKYSVWQVLETGFEAVATTHTINLETIPGPQPDTVTSGCYVDSVTRHTVGDDITNLVLGDGDISFREGRDQARSLSAVGPSETEFEFKNEDRQYSPNNPLSLLYGRPGSGASMEIRALFEGRFYTLFNGYIDDFVIEQELPTSSQIHVTAFDQLGRMGAIEISTELYPSFRTGDAMHVVLDAIGWPEDKRSIDYGATVMNWWWEENTTALEAVTKLVYSEGLPAFIYIDEFNNFVFRDRHHRYMPGDSTEVVAFFSECEEAPQL